MKKLCIAALASIALPFISGAAQSAEADQTRLTGEFIDTWCYISEVMGAGEAITGSAHHQCAVWCAAGGIPVGLLTEDGTVYFVMSLGEDDTSAANDAILEIQSHKVTVEGTVHERDGMKYLMIASIINDEGLVNQNHDDFGVIPDFGVPQQ